MIADTVAHFAARGCHVIYDAEHYFDGRRSDHDYALETLCAAVRAGAHCVTLCDTNGGTMPGEIYEATREAVELLPRADRHSLSRRLRTGRRGDA